MIFEGLPLSIWRDGIATTYRYSLAVVEVVAGTMIFNTSKVKSSCTYKPTDEIRSVRFYFRKEVNASLFSRASVLYISATRQNDLGPLLRISATLIIERK